MKVTIATRMTCVLLLAGLAPSIIIGYLSYKNSVQMITKELQHNLDAYAATKANHINTYFDGRRTDVESLAHSPVIVNATTRLVAAGRTEGARQAIPADMESELRSFLVFHIDAHEYDDVYIISPSGDIVFSTSRAEDSGANLKVGRYRNSELAKSFDGAVTILETAVSDFRYFDPFEEPAAFVASPVLRKGVVVGVLAAQMNAHAIYRLAQNYTGLGRTGEIVIASRIGNDAVFLNPLRHDPDAAFKRRLTIGSEYGVPIQQAVQGKKGRGVFDDYRGEEVLAAWRYLPHLRLGMVVKQDTAEAYAPVLALRDRSLGIGLASLLALIGVTVFLSRTVSVPIKDLTRTAELMAGGDLSVRSRIRSQDEIGELARCFNWMVANLSKLFSDLDARGKELEENAERLMEAKTHAEAADRAKSEFLANMSHEIRTPMTAILGFAETVAENVTNPENVEAIATVRRNGDYLLGIINDILDLSKVEAGKMTLEQVQCNPCQIIAEVASLMGVRADAKGLSFNIEFVGAIPETINSDPTRLRQILINLIGNAIKFTEVGNVRLVTRLIRDGDGPRLQFDVIDTGCGITEEQRSKLFRPFMQGDATTTRNFGGTGLGLTISKRFAELLGGDITVAATVTGMGTTFCATISTGPLDGVKMLEDPMSATVVIESVTTAAMAAPLALAGFRILLAEDGPDNQRLISFVLKKAGADVTIEANGELALKAALKARDEGNPFDAILMDIQMPIMDGYEAAGQLRRKGYTGAIIALTAHAMEGDREKCIAAGCDDYATKPIDRTKLVETIRRQLVRGQAVCPLTT